MKKQSKLQLAKKEAKKQSKKSYEEETKSLIADLKTRKKDISRQLDLLEKSVINWDEEKERKAQRTLGVLMLDLILEDFGGKIYNESLSDKRWAAIRKWSRLSPQSLDTQSRIRI